MMDPIEGNKEKLLRLQEENNILIKQLIDLVNKLNLARDKAQKSLSTMQNAIDEAHKDYVEYVNSLEVIRVNTTNLLENKNG